MRMSAEYAGLVPQWLENNKSYVKNVFSNLPEPWHMSERRKLVTDKTSIVLTCLDPRCVPENFFGPNMGGAVFRNAGGRATDDVIRSITALRELADLRTIVVVHHTDCGVMHITPQEIITTVAKSGAAAASAAEMIDYKLFSFGELEQSIRNDVHVLKEAPTLKGMNVYGFKLDTFTGLVEPVE
ncbi:hypothetical protein N0V93_009568 [Gnomoniopsis smithogilvyi]|uniref:Carbonic anhydrase n=1 Tax=Gnomoniopsis smithogilvyi TaxID=1191159 RepID=A0A9W8YJV5_9PEZI|nr:hypothetical protein N0V93_009568 [Gnomoniopsis smithogilvyi]